MTRFLRIFVPAWAVYCLGSLIFNVVIGGHSWAIALSAASFVACILMSILVWNEELE